MDKKETIVSVQTIRKKTALALVLFTLFIGGCIVGWKWLNRQPEVQGAPAPLRTVLNTNELIFSNMFSNQRLSKTYEKNAVVPRVRINGHLGMELVTDTANWSLTVIKHNRDTLSLNLDEIKKLPKTEIVFDFKCIEGWSQVTHWGGVKFSDFVKHYGLQAEAALQFTGMETPDGKYYVGLDNKSMMHPQTLLCYEMNGKPLPVSHGYPLRLIIPVKYGVKHLKRIGTIFFSDDRPRDYWYQRGYDYYCGL